MLRRGFRLFSKALLKGEAKACGGLLGLFRRVSMPVNELDALVGLDEDVPDAAERARLDEIGPLGVSTVMDTSGVLTTHFFTSIRFRGFSTAPPPKDSVELRAELASACPPTRRSSPARPSARRR